MTSHNPLKTLDDGTIIVIDTSYNLYWYTPKEMLSKFPHVLNEAATGIKPCAIWTMMQHRCIWQIFLDNKALPSFELLNYLFNNSNSVDMLLWGDCGGNMYINTVGAYKIIDDCFQNRNILQCVDMLIDGGYDVST